jgi:transcriptional regulator with XRE-family HTH domain
LIYYIRISGKKGDTMRYRTQEEVGAELRRLRLEAGASQQHVADLLGISQPAVYNLETGQRGLTARELVALSDYYGVPSVSIVSDVRPEVVLFRGGDNDAAALQEANAVLDDIIEDYWGIAALVP